MTQTANTKIVARPIKPFESDLLIGHERCTLRFVTPPGGHDLQANHPPQGGWTHDALEAVVPPTVEPWDAFLGTQWVGSSEI